MKKLFALFFALILIFVIKAQENEISSVPYSISENINTSGSEHLPNLTADGKTIYFCGSNRDDNLGLEDIFVSHFKEGEWTKAEILGELSTSSTNDAPLAVSTDENSIIIFRDGKMYSTERTSNGWTEPKLFDELNYKSWNCDACYTVDGNAIIFTSGEWSGNTIVSDIYVIQKQNDGSWAEPINLGKTVNAGSYNRSGYLHADMKTFYFSTNGYDGEGQLDIYKCTRQDENSWTKWSKPINLGNNINKSGHDWAFKLNTQGTKGIYNVTIDGQTDIYVFDLKEEIQPERVVTVTGVITDKNNNPLDAEIVWEDLVTGDKKGTLKSNPTTGEYIIILPLDKNYGFYVSKEGYYPESDNLNLIGNVTNYNVKKDFSLLNIEQVMEGEAIRLKNLFFETGKHNLKKESFPELNRLAKFLNDNPSAKIEIGGHTDDVGSDSYNQNLSELRANAVKDYLLEKGCYNYQVKAVGYGESKPIMTNETQEGRYQNRRVEFKVLEN